VRKTEEIAFQGSCFNKAKDDERLFVLLARDAAAPVAIRAWVAERLRLGKNREGDPQIVEALACAKLMESGEGGDQRARPTAARHRYRRERTVTDRFHVVEGEVVPGEDAEIGAFQGWALREVERIRFGPVPAEIWLPILVRAQSLFALIVRMDWMRGCVPEVYEYLWASAFGGAGPDRDYLHWLLCRPSVRGPDGYRAEWR